MLSAYRVLDCTDERGFLAGKILGDLGADVVKLEPPGGDPVRRRGPFVTEAGNGEDGLAWLALNTSKRGVTLDLWRPEAPALFRRLVERCDVLLESYAPGTLASLGIGWHALHAAQPGLIQCAITPFGQDGPYAQHRATDLSVVAMGGNAFLTGHPGAPPLRCSMPTSYYHGAAEAALGIALALHARARTGRGQLVDLSLQECQVITTVGAPGRHVAYGSRQKRSGGHMAGTREIWRARDGWVSFGLRGGPARIPNLRATVAYMDECGEAPDWLREYDWSAYRPPKLPAAELARLEAAFGAFFRNHTMRELYEEALARRILLAPCNDSREILEHPQLRDRELFVTLDYPELGAKIEHPAFFARSSRHALRVSRRAPRLGEHNAELYGEIGIAPGSLDGLARKGVV